MTGLDPDADDIIEIFCLVTDGNLQLLDDEGFGVVVHQPQERMDKMDAWCTRVHGASGLTAAVVASRVTPQQAADGLLTYIQRFVPQPGIALLAGNSVHADKAFLRRGPYAKVDRHLHYRILDVSSIKEAAKRWAPQTLARTPRKEGLHQAKADILESLAEARYYRDVLFAPALARGSGDGPERPPGGG